MVKVIIAGGSDFKDYELLRYKCDYFLGNIEDSIEIVSGGQVTTDDKTGEKYGADYLGEMYAKERGYAVKRFDADWGKFGRSAGPIRNKGMGNYCTPDGCLIAFWDGESKGTKSMITIAWALELRTKVVFYGL